MALVARKLLDAGPVRWQRTAGPSSVAASSTVATYTSLSIGQASPDRIVVLLVGTELNNSDPSAATIDTGGGPVSMTAGQVGTFGGTSPPKARAFWLAVPTGETATFAITFGATSPTELQNQIAVYRVFGSPVFLSDGADGTTDADATDPLTTGSITIPPDGLFIAISSNAINGAPRTWTNAIEDIDNSVGTAAFRFSTAIRTEPGTVTITCESNQNGEDAGMSWLIFERDY